MKKSAAIIFLMIATGMPVYTMELHSSADPVLVPIHQENTFRGKQVEADTKDGRTGLDDCNVGDMYITHIDHVNNFIALYGECTAITGSLTIAFSTDLSFLANLTSVENLSITGSPTLTNLNGLQNLTTVAGNLTMINLGITDLSGLEQLTHAGGIFIRYLPALTSLSGLSSLASANAITIMENPLLTNFNSLQSLIAVDEDIAIYDNPSLTGLNGLQNLTSVGQSLAIHGSPNLTSLGGLQSLTSVGGNVSFYGLGISNLDEPGQLTTITGGISIENNPLLTSIDGFQSLTSVGGGIQIHENPDLTSLNGFQNLVSVGDGLSLYQLGLIDLNGFGQLESVGAGLSIELLPQLTSLGGLSNLSTVGTFINVVHNAALSTCAFEVFCEKLENTPEQVGFNGNATGCATNGEVVNACNALPVTLARFEVSLEGRTTLLNWTTTSEMNSDYFEVQHTIAAGTWEVLGQVRSDGESAALRNYTFSHNTSSDGIHYYRLRMVDKDGSFAYSPLKSVSLEGGLFAYPNPATDRLTLKNTENIDRLEVLSLTGARVLTSNGIPSDGVDLSRLSPGLYTVRVIRNDGSFVSGKIAVVK